MGIKRVLSHITILALSASMLGAADYAKAKQEAKAEENTVIVETTIPKTNNSGLETIVKGMLPVNYAKMKLDYNTGKMVPDAEETNTQETSTEKKKEEKKGFNPFSINNLAWEVPLLAAIGGGIYLLTKKPPVQTGKVNATVNLIDSFTGENLSSGTVKFIYNGNTVNGTPGQSTYIADVNKGTSINVQIVADSGNYVQRKILQASMAEGTTSEYTINLMPVSKNVLIDGANYAFSSSSFLKEIVGYPSFTYIQRLKIPANGELNMYFNPDRRGTGKRLPDTIINELIKAWDWIKNNSNGEITNIIYHRDGTKAISDPVGNGEIYVYDDTTGPTASSALKQNSDGSGYGVYLFFNSTHIATGDNVLWTESFDSMFNNEINLSKATWLPLFKMGFKRIAGRNNGYLIDGTHEEQTLPDKYSGAISTSALSQALNAFSQFNSALKQGNMSPIDLRKRINIGQRASIEASLTPAGINLAGNYNLGNGNLMVVTDPTGKNLIIGADKRIGQHSMAVIYDNNSRKAMMSGTFTLPLGINLSGGIDNIANPKIVPLSLSVNKNGFGFTGSVNNALNPTYAAGQASFSTGDINGAVSYIHNKLGPDMIGAGITYDLGKYQLTGNISRFNKTTALDIGVLAKTFSIMEGKANFFINAGIDEKGNKRIYISCAGREN